jgi:hypothetical protein
MTAPALAARTATEMDQLLLVTSWFRQHPEAFEATTPYAGWLAGRWPARPLHPAPSEGSWISY